MSAVIKPSPTRHGLLGISCLLAMAGLLQAAAPDGRLFEPDRAWLENYDPTLVSSRFFTEFIDESHESVG
jgi:hypothetical protein